MYYGKVKRKFENEINREICVLCICNINKPKQSINHKNMKDCCLEQEPC